MELINVKRYYPEHKPYGEDVQYFQSEDGRDFDESIPLFTKKYKLCISPVTGIICSVAEDVSALYPAGFTVVEVDELPEGVNIDGNWQFSDGLISKVPVNWKTVAENRRSSLLQEANETVDDWKTELKLDMISDENKLQLTRWMAYIRQLKEMHFNDIASEGHYQAIPWPEKPE
ncbi:phage tail protein [Escherichia coli]|nr:phage tail protein [Escherichia coli]